ncbi:hypothetical protein GHT06_019291 [Daphnia sinensis]|uniref:Uncharacterized protein n=1 Tax=Daphnia sinensis TaxID=1820382 RepID=A0AAD5KKJ7_9CRUS|nr:hypothetical protein GHT06_019291 [Daphnia sinensis]
MLHVVISNIKNKKQTRRGSCFEKENTSVILKDRNESRIQFIKKATSISSAWVEDTVHNGIEKSWNEVVVKYVRKDARSTTLLAHTNMETMAAAHLHNGSILLLAKINSFL